MMMMMILGGHHHWRRVKGGLSSTIRFLCTEQHFPLEWWPQPCGDHGPVRQGTMGAENLAVVKKRFVAVAAAVVVPEVARLLELILVEAILGASIGVTGAAAVARWVAVCGGGGRRHRVTVVPRIPPSKVMRRIGRTISGGRRKNDVAACNRWWGWVDIDAELGVSSGLEQPRGGGGSVMSFCIAGGESGR